MCLVLPNPRVLKHFRLFRHYRFLTWKTESLDGNSSCCIERQQILQASATGPVSSWLERFLNCWLRRNPLNSFYMWWVLLLPYSHQMQGKWNQKEAEGWGKEILKIQAEMKRGVVGITKRRTHKEKKIRRRCTTSVLEGERRKGREEVRITVNIIKSSENFFFSFFEWC